MRYYVEKSKKRSWLYRLDTKNECFLQKQKSQAFSPVQTNRNNPCLNILKLQKTGHRYETFHLKSQPRIPETYTSLAVSMHVTFMQTSLILK